MFLREALKKICHDVPEAETSRLLSQNNFFGNTDICAPERRGMEPPK